MSRLHTRSGCKRYPFRARQGRTFSDEMCVTAPVLQSAELAYIEKHLHI